MDKYSAVWVSHSSIGDFRNCPRAYYLNNVYKDPTTGHKITITSPALALGSTVHNVLESLSTLPVQDRFQTPLLELFEKAWSKVEGIKGGFPDPETEESYKKRGQDMLSRVAQNPGPLKELAVKINLDLPNYWLSEEDGIILCGKIDWLEYNKSDDSVRILDFKTGRHEEKPDSLQLPIYYLLAHNCQTREVKGASYWYLDHDDIPVSQPLPDLDVAGATILKHAKEIKLARQLNRFKCKEGEGGCKYCRPYEKVIKGLAKFVGSDSYNQDVYVLDNQGASTEPSSTIL